MPGYHTTQCAIKMLNFWWIDLDIQFSCSCPLMYCIIVETELQLSAIVLVKNLLNVPLQTLLVVFLLDVFFRHSYTHFSRLRTVQK